MGALFGDRNGSISPNVFADPLILRVALENEATEPSARGCDRSGQRPHGSAGGRDILRKNDPFAPGRGAWSGSSTICSEAGLRVRICGTMPAPCGDERFR